MITSKPIKVPMIQSMIIELRGMRVILDKDLARIYGIDTRALNQAVNRNIKRFPKDFCFELTREEIMRISQFVISYSTLKFAKKVRAFTRNGANMVCTIIKTPVAIQRSIQIMRAFSALEEAISRKRKTLIQSPDVLQKLSTHSRAIMRLFQESKLNHKEIAKVKKIQEEMIKLLQQMIFASLGKRE